MNTELGGDEVMHVKTVDAVGDHMTDSTKTATTTDATTIDPLLDRQKYIHLH